MYLDRRSRQVLPRRTALRCQHSLVFPAIAALLAAIFAAFATAALAGLPFAPSSFAATPVAPSASESGLSHGGRLLSAHGPGGD